MAVLIDRTESILELLVSQAPVPGSQGVSQVRDGVWKHSLLAAFPRGQKMKQPGMRHGGTLGFLC